MWKIETLNMNYEHEIGSHPEVIPLFLFFFHFFCFSHCCCFLLIVLLLIVSGGILGSSPYALGGIPSGLPIVSAVPNASALTGAASNYVSSRYVVGNQAAIVHGYTGTGCGEYLSNKSSHHPTVYSR